jgi:hypothetical protein
VGLPRHLVAAKHANAKTEAESDAGSVANIIYPQIAQINADLFKLKDIINADYICQDHRIVIFLILKVMNS